MHAWIVYLHVLGAFIFVSAHGASMVTAFRLRSQTDQARIAELLELSGLSIGLMYVGLLLLLGGGVVAGFTGGHWGRAWIWVSLGLLVVVIVVMFAVATPFYGRMRAAAGLPRYADQAQKYKPPAEPSQLAELRTSPRPFILAAVGAIGLAVILGLMLFKPF